MQELGSFFRSSILTIAIATAVPTDACMCAAALGPIPYELGGACAGMHRIRPCMMTMILRNNNIYMLALEHVAIVRPLVMRVIPDIRSGEAIAWITSAGVCTAPPSSMCTFHQHAVINIPVRMVKVDA